MRDAEPSSFAADLRCPDDGTVLRVTSVDLGTFGVCRHCDGVWMARRVLEAPYPVKLPIATKLALRARDKEQPRLCSACGTPMRTERVDVTLDVCPNCGGVWMDPGEYHFARKLGARSRRNKTAPPGLNAPKTAAGRLLSSVIDLIAEVLIEKGHEFEEPEIIPRRKRRR